MHTRRPRRDERARLCTGREVVVDASGGACGRASGLCGHAHLPAGLPAQSRVHHPACMFAASPACVRHVRHAAGEPGGESCAVAVTAPPELGATAICQAVVMTCDDKHRRGAHWRGESNPLLGDTHMYRPHA